MAIRKSLCKSFQSPKVGLRLLHGIRIKRSQSKKCHSVMRLKLISWPQSGCKLNTKSPDPIPWSKLLCIMESGKKQTDNSSSIRSNLREVYLTLAPSGTMFTLKSRRTIGKIELLPREQCLRNLWDSSTGMSRKKASQLIIRKYLPRSDLCTSCEKINNKRFFNQQVNYLPNKNKKVRFWI